MPTNTPPGQLPGVTLTNPTTNGFVSATNLEITRSGNTAIETNCNVYVAFPVKFLAGQVKKAFSFQSTGDIGATGVGNFYTFISDNTNPSVGYQFSALTTIGIQIAAISSPSVVEGSPLVFTVALSAVTATVLTAPLVISGTATSAVDYTTIPTLSRGVTLANGAVTIPIGISDFTISFNTLADVIVEPAETLIVNIAGIVGIGTLLDNGSTGVPTQTVTSVSSPTASEGANLVFNIYLSGTTQQVQNFAFSIAGTATAGTDYAFPLTFNSGVTINGTNLVIPIGVSSFTGTTLTATDALTEPTETIIFTLDGVAGTGSITNVPISGTVWDSGATSWDAGASAWIN